MGRIALKELQDLVACMRASGVTRLRDGDLEIDLTADAPGAATTTDAEHQVNAWPDGDGDVYTSEFSYPRGVPHLKRYQP